MPAGFGKACSHDSFEVAVKIFSCPEADAEMAERLSAMATHKATWRQIKLRTPASLALQHSYHIVAGVWGYPQKGQKNSSAAEPMSWQAVFTQAVSNSRAIENG
ncbi:hypothetical protein FJW07_07030 [Mesorhizobium sp. B3-1-9]|uniref:hypothetical protein n=1 Tax=Mesorhizobium sp. B3-1-9 TaxID=2589892 RepID=UPI00112D9455|nr:hypothetical protein [Mesorhizobium sp. B3-1-9]TPI41009.1 hypothetical protein FJW07_07030 [Mesorhizobium sp. B3-1-9]